MSTDDATTDAIATGALLVGGGVVGYLGARWLASLATPDSLDDVPVSSPDQAMPSSTTDGAPLPRTFDPIFARHAGPDLPIEFLRALAWSESRMNPSARGRSAWGLLQIVERVRAHYNETHRTSYARAHLLDPAINVAIAAWLLRTIRTSYATHHPDVPNLRADWSNPRFVELLVFGWNAGYSERAGVGLVVGWLERQGIRAIDIDRVRDSARDARASKHVADAAKVRWCKGVAALHQRERAPASASAA